MIKILVVDDSALVRKLIGQAFSTQTDFEVRFARNGREALDAIASSRPDVVTLDVHMPEMDGLACLDRIMIETPCPVVMVSSMTAAGADATLEALRLGAIDFVAKPTGAVSLRFDDVAKLLIEKVRAAAGARLKTTLRLRERVRFRIGEHGRLRKRRPEKPNKLQRPRVWFWSEHRPEVRLRWKRLSRPSRVVSMAYHRCPAHAGYLHRAVSASP